MPTDTLGLAAAKPVPRKRRLPGDRRRWAAGASVLALALLWWAATRFGWVDVLFLPAPEQLFEALQRLWQEGYLDASLLQHVGTSLLRVLLALGAAVLTAIPLGVLMGLNPLAGAALDPLVEFYRPIPPLAYLPLIVIWFGIGELSKVLLIYLALFAPLLIYLALFAPLLIATAAGVRRVDRSRVQAVRCLGASRWQVVRYVILPSALPEVLTGLRIALGVGWSTLVAAELIAANRGLGFMVQSAAQFLATDVVVVGILLIAAIALAFELGLRWVQRRFAAWG
ncbi:ABC transporter permease subunit [Pseudomonas aeruginosa]|uniref:ABC transporter permease subunit n=10 Tax=Pseudomonas aeruginosa TaxID=287 RepID=UPI003D267D7B